MSKTYEGQGKDASVSDHPGVVKDGWALGSWGRSPYRDRRISEMAPIVLNGVGGEGFPPPRPQEALSLQKFNAEVTWW